MPNRLRYLAIAAGLFFSVTTSPLVFGQTYTVLHEFTGGADGGVPQVGVSLDRAGNIYGTTAAGDHTYGVVWEIKHDGGTFHTLFTFSHIALGNEPLSRPTIASDGSLYGSTSGSLQSGLIYRLQPPATFSRSAETQWKETILYNFGGFLGAGPSGDLTFDAAGDIYGTTQQGGPANTGVIYEMTKIGGQWVALDLYTSIDGPDGNKPIGGVIFDNGLLYGTFSTGGPDGSGTLFRLLPALQGFTEEVLHVFDGNHGGNPTGGLITDFSGNIYGTTNVAQGTVFKLSYPSLTFNVIYSWSGSGDNCGPSGKLVMDSFGNLYGTTVCNGTYGYGEIFKLQPVGSSWVYFSLYDFTGAADGANPNGDLALDGNLTLYGTTAHGGTYGNGVVFEIGVY